MGRKLVVLAMLVFTFSINTAYSGIQSEKISELSSKFRYALFLLNDKNAHIIREYLLSANVPGSPVRFNLGKYYRIYLLTGDNDEGESGCLCDDVEMSACHTLPVNTPVAAPKINPFFPPDDLNALRIPKVQCQVSVICGQRLTEKALRTPGETFSVNRQDLEKCPFVYLKKRPDLQENRIFFTHNRASESNIIMVIRRSFKVMRPGSEFGEESGSTYHCLEISIPVGTFEFATLPELISLENEYSSCTDLWREQALEQGVPEQVVPVSAEELADFSDIALGDCLTALEHNWCASNPIDNPMVEQVIGTGISSQVVSLFHRFRSLAFKRLYKTCSREEDAREVISSARINLLLLTLYGIPVAPMRYEMVYNPLQGHYAVYCIQALYAPGQLSDHYLENPDVSAEDKLKLINTIIHYMNLCDICNGYQLRVDDGFKGYFRVALDSNYPNFCLINGDWHMIDLSPFFWAVGDHFSEANQHILDMSQSEDYYSFIKSLCTCPVQLYVFFCGRMYRTYQKYSQSSYPDDQRKALDWLAIYHYAVRKVSALPQISQEFCQDKWRKLSPFDQKNHEGIWQTLVDERNSDPSPAFLDGVVELVRQNREADKPVVLESAISPRQQPPSSYLSFLEELGWIDTVAYLSAPEERRRDRKQIDVMDLVREQGDSSPQTFFSRFHLKTPDETAHLNLYLEYLRTQELVKKLSLSMAEDNNQRAANRRRLQQQERAVNPPPSPVIFTELTALNDKEMANLLHIQFNVQYLPIESDGNCLWQAIAIALRKRGMVINPDHLMQNVLQQTGGQPGMPAHQQNWGDTDFIAKILAYLAHHGANVNIVVLQPYGSELVGIWYGLVNGQLVVDPLGNNPVHLYQTIHNPNNIILVNHQNGVASDFQVFHWGAAVPIAPAPPLVTENISDPEEVLPEAPDNELQEKNKAQPSAKKPKVTPEEDAEPSTPPTVSILPPPIYESLFTSRTGLSLLSVPSPEPPPASPQPLAHFRDWLLSLISEYLLICNRDQVGCKKQLESILSLLPQNQQLHSQDLNSGHIEPFLHILAAFLHWMNPQPVNVQAQAGQPEEELLTGITLIFPSIRSRNFLDFSAWRLTLTRSSGDYLHIQRQFIPTFSVDIHHILDKHHLSLVTNVPVTPSGRLAWPFHQPLLAHWWLVTPGTSALWMLGTQLEHHVLSVPPNDPIPKPGTGLFSSVKVLIPLLLYSKQWY